MNKYETSSDAVVKEFAKARDRIAVAKIENDPEAGKPQSVQYRTKRRRKHKRRKKRLVIFPDV